MQEGDEIVLLAGFVLGSNKESTIAPSVAGTVSQTGDTATFKPAAPLEYGGMDGEQTLDPADHGHAPAAPIG